jgi:hypothetical protein
MLAPFPTAQSFINRPNGVQMRAPWGLTMLAFVMGCGGTTLVVDSDTSWTGSVDGYGAISGRLSAEYDLRAGGGQCWTVSKATEAGTLRVYSKTSEWFGLGTEVNGESTTTQPMGTVTGCAS